MAVGVIEGNAEPQHPPDGSRGGNRPGEPRLDATAEDVLGDLSSPPLGGAYRPARAPLFPAQVPLKEMRVFAVGVVAGGADREERAHDATVRSATASVSARRGTSTTWPSCATRAAGNSALASRSRTRGSSE